MAEAAIWMLRHGETPSRGRFRGSLDDELTDDGFAQMHDGARGAADVELVVTSPLRRCRVFAAAFAESRDIEVEIEPGFRELHFGQWEGLEARDIAQRDPALLEAFWRDPRSVTPPDGEPFARFEARVEHAWRRTRRRAQRQILVVTHAGPIRLVTVMQRRLPLARLLEIPVPHGSLHYFSPR